MPLSFVHNCYDLPESNNLDIVLLISVKVNPNCAVLKQDKWFCTEKFCWVKFSSFHWQKVCCDDSQKGLHFTTLCDSSLLLMPNLPFIGNCRFHTYNHKYGYVLKIQSVLPCSDQHSIPVNWLQYDYILDQKRQTCGMGLQSTEPSFQSVFLSNKELNEHGKYFEIWRC